MATYTWNSGTSGNWSTPGNWSGGSAPPSSDTADKALFKGTSTSYTVTISGDESIGVLQLQAPSGTAGFSLDISGALTVTTQLVYGSLATGSATPINIEAGGLLHVVPNLSSTWYDIGSLPETISIAGTGSGGTLELGGDGGNFASTALTFSFSNNAPGTENAGLVEYDTISGPTEARVFTNVGWGDNFIFYGQNYGGDTVSYSGTTLTISSGTTAVLTFTNFHSSLSNFDVIYNAAGGYSELEAVCFARGTLIRTPDGEIAVERLRTGDTVLVQENGALTPRHVVWRGHRRIDLAAHPKPERVSPVRIRAGAFGDDLPARDLIVSPDHALLIDGRLIMARQLVNGASIVREEGWSAVDYYHVELERHAILLAEGLPAESYLDTGNRGFFANSGAPLILHPDLAEDRSALAREAGACAPFVVDEASVRPVWQRLADRAAALGLHAPETARTSDPALRLIAKGRSIAPVFAEAGLYIFSLPLGATGARIASRAAEPAALRPWLDDRRVLGVAVKRIVLRTAEDAMEVPVDSPELHDGWWDVEQAAGTAFRWTSGSALLPFPTFKGHAMLELHLHGTAEYPVEAETARQAEVA